VSMREAAYMRYGGTQEKLGYAMEALARGLLAAGLAGEALPVAEESLAIHQLEYGGTTRRAHELRRVVFVAQVGAEMLDDAFRLEKTLLGMHQDAGAWPEFIEEVFWISEIYADAGMPSHATKVLAYARQATLMYDLDDLAHAVDARLLNLGLDPVSLLQDK
jgi:hypothetical protein